MYDEWAQKYCVRGQERPVGREERHQSHNKKICHFLQVVRRHFASERSLLIRNCLYQFEIKGNEIISQAMRQDDDGKACIAIFEY